MPPKPKFTKEEIVETAFRMTKENGFNSVTARELGKKLGTSSTPIFTVFKNMNEVRESVRELAMKEFEKYVADILEYTPAFKKFGVQMIQFALEEPQLFRVLYMEENEESKSFEEMRKELGTLADRCLELIQKDYSVSEPEAEQIFRQAWVFTFSICVLLVNKICHFSSEEIIEMMGLQFQGTLLLIKTGQYVRMDVTEKKNEKNEKKKDTKNSF
ncbi:MAG: TetR/AcrR family transcriptional regulator [Clostridiales bacterium]|nr:TetR/AcrR family transcriptional regulator [Clostridiales bacterium]